MCEMSISLPVHTICTVCAVLVKENQLHRFGIKGLLENMWNIQFVYVFVLQYCLNTKSYF